MAVPERNLTADVDALLAAVTPRTRILYLANPNNPTGSYLPEAELRRLHAGLPENVLLVIDAAYAEFVGAADYISGQEMATEFSNVVMTRTFSKIYALGVLHNHQARQWFAERLRGLGLTVYPSEANFLLASFAGWANPETVRQFLKARGILVRQMTAYGLPDCLRITIGRSDELREVVDALSAYPR